MTQHQEETIKLPEQLVSSVDMARIIRELEALDESIRQTKLRKAGEPTKLARSSVTLEELASLNKIALTNDTQRDQLLDLLKAFQKHAPRIHMSFAGEPSAKFTREIIAYLRTNIHPVVLLEIGLQPTLAAGCMVRTKNKMFDMSLRHNFKEKRHLLAEKIGLKGLPIETSEAEQTVPAVLPDANTPTTPAPAQPVANTQDKKL